MLARNVAEGLETRPCRAGETAVAEAARPGTTLAVLPLMLSPVLDLDEMFRALECSSSPRNPNPGGSIGRNSGHNGSTEHCRARLLKKNLNLGGKALYLLVPAIDVRRW